MAAEPPRPAPECITIGSAQLWHGDCRDVLPLLTPVSAVVTDPPYGLSFMGKRWDYDVPDSALWALVLDRLLPGAGIGLVFTAISLARSYLLRRAFNYWGQRT